MFTFLYQYSQLDVSAIEVDNETREMLKVLDFNNIQNLQPIEHKAPGQLPYNRRNWI